ncbi:type IV pilin protein [Neptunomonas antarctica]|uniref:Type IV pilus assembly protein PilE n=1 Tax=Neptunomonas antarctica TaxID=619304 RepID=A0A1N7MG90_9GAMM|nr:type IV pilin protein [Neptunomonas antarctica]SIS85146.1 type IV pilus assembly protein PilE [Neptunomonas antarctica]
MKKQQGFSLIELMIVVAIVAILASIAYPSYQQYVLKSWRNTAAGCLLDLAQGMERRYTSNMSYVGVAIPAASCTAENGIAARYTFSFPADPTAQAFTLQAAPQGAQASDVQCGTLSITHVGVRAASGPGSAQECW